MLQFHGRPEHLNSPSHGSSLLRRRGTFALIFHDSEQEPTTQPACRYFRSKKLLAKEEKIQINVSGKRYQMTSRLLKNFPNSLLGNPAKRQLYTENGEMFFDRNRIAFESVFSFYTTGGKLVLPNDGLSEQLVADELYFFGVYDYLSQHDKRYSLPLPRRLQTKKLFKPKGVYRKKIWEVCEVPASSTFGRILNLFSLFVITLAVVLAFVSSLPNIRSSRDFAEITTLRNTTSHRTSNQNHTTTTTFSSLHAMEFIFKAELCCIAWFTLELLVRFIVAPEKRKFFLRVLNIIDIVAVLPFYISLIASIKNMVPIYIIKVFRLSRIFQVLKIPRLNSKMKVVGKTAKACVYDVWTIVFLTCIGTVLFGSTVYYCEQWDDETVFLSIPHACWWAVVTISTLGYGDMVPKTLGKSKNELNRTLIPTDKTRGKFVCSCSVLAK